ncbi:MAG: VWA domain-containing protein, partial [Myxococcales bacterium]|nr:VWA domain-containing protein [Myxococcales bacterium]
APPAAAQAPLSLAADAPPPAEAGSVALEVLPQFKALTDDVTELNVLVRLTGTSDAPAQRPPLDLALVLDRSGSMRGDKMRDVKAAGLQLLEALGPSDRVTLLSYSDQVLTHAVRLPVDGQGREELRRALLAIEANGGTALGPATAEALDLLERAADDAGRTAHVMLLSDGLANVGEQRPDVLGARTAAGFRQGVTFSTLGVGVDYNEDLMTRLADAGGGRYHFIQSGQAVARVLDDELKGLVATVARGVELDLALPAGVELVKVFGYPTRQDDGRHSVRIGTLGARQVREVMIRLRLPMGRDGDVALGKIGLRYVDMPADGVAREAIAGLAVARAASADAMRQSEAPAVSVRVAEVESAEQLELAARAADRGDFAQAQGLLRVAIDDLRRKDMVAPSPKLKAQIAAFEEADGEMEGARASESGRKGYTKKLKSRAYESKKR